MVLVDCSRYHARITPAACSAYQAKDAINCKGCSGYVATAGEDDVTEPVVKDKHGKPIRACAKCGETKPILGRGMCQKCYQRALYLDKQQMKAKPPAPNGPQSVAAVLWQQKEPIFQEGMPAAAPISKEDGEHISLWFRGEDIAMYDQIISKAKAERRQPMEQVLWLLEFSLRGLL